MIENKEVAMKRLIIAAVAALVVFGFMAGYAEAAPGGKKGGRKAAAKAKEHPKAAKKALKHHGEHPRPEKKASAETRKHSGKQKPGLERGHKKGRDGGKSLKKDRHHRKAVRKAWRHFLKDKKGPGPAKKHPGAAKKELKHPKKAAHALKNGKGRK